MKKLEIVGKVEEIGELVIINRKDKAPLYKVVVTLSASGDQTLYLDVLNKRIGEMNALGVKKGSVIKVSFSFKGSNHENKKFNNVFCERIELHNKKSLV